jgi:histidinol phosphatase-like PHP family hydrolase
VEGVRKAFPGVVALGTDAHYPEQFGYMELSLAAACLAKIAPERIINFMPLSELKQWVASVRRNLDLD